MRLIKSSFEILEQEPGIEGIYKQVEKAGRVAYKSENYITENSHKKFISMLYDKGHFSPYEHGTVYLKTPLDYTRLDNNPYSVTNIHENYKYITTNLRVVTENNCTGVFTFLSEPTEYHEKRITVKFICDRGVSHKKFVA